MDHAVSILKNSMRQFVSQELPPSFENACSHLGLLPAPENQLKRIRIGTPSSTSSAKNVPTPSLKLPRTGVSRFIGFRPSSHQIDQVDVSLSKDLMAAARNSPLGKHKMLSSKLPKPP